MPEPVYRILPAIEIIKVSNGARKYRTTDRGDRVLSAAYTEYSILRIVGTEDDPSEVRYADPSNPAVSWRSRYRARQAVQERLIHERNKQHANGQGPGERRTASKARRRVPTQSELDSRWAGSHAASMAVGV